MVAGSNKYNQLSVQQLNDWRAEGREFTLIDTLPSDHFQRIRLPGARNACVYQVIFKEEIKALTEDVNGVIVLYGSSARSMDAITAAKKLTHLGFRHIYILQGGIEAWRNAEYAFEGGGDAASDDPQTHLKLEDRSFSIDPDLSAIEWTGRNPTTTHFGNIQFSSGKLSVQNGFITGRLEINMHSITNTNLEGDEIQPVLVAHLKSDDFFLVDDFPTASFQIYSGRPVKKPYITYPNFEIQGALMLRGSEVEQSFMATVAWTADDQLSIEAHFDIDRTRWGIIYGSTRFFEHLGMHLVFDLISIQMRIIAR